jgi:methyl-accepting chemotaxis protein
VRALKSAVHSTKDAVKTLDSAKERQELQTRQLASAMVGFTEVAARQAARAEELNGCIDTVDEESRALMSEVQRFRI